MLSSFTSSIAPHCTQGPVVCNVNFQLPTLTTYTSHHISTSNKADWSTVEQTCKQIFELVEDKQRVTSNEELERAALLSLQLMANLKSVAESQQEQYKPPSPWGAHKSNEEPSSSDSSQSSASQALLAMHVPPVNPTWLHCQSTIPTRGEFKTMREAQRLQQHYKEQQMPLIKQEQHPLESQSSSRFQMLQVWRKAQNRPKIIKPKNRHQCDKCNTSVTPQWRKGPNGPGSLCNACGLRYANRCKKDEDIRMRYNSHQIRNEAASRLNDYYITAKDSEVEHWKAFTPKEVI